MPRCLFRAPCHYLLRAVAGTNFIVPVSLPKTTLFRSRLCRTNQKIVCSSFFPREKRSSWQRLIKTVCRSRKGPARWARLPGAAGRCSDGSGSRAPAGGPSCLRVVRARWCASAPDRVLDCKRQVPKSMIGRPLSQEEAKRWLRLNEETSPRDCPESPLVGATATMRSRRIQF